MSTTRQGRGRGRGRGIQRETGEPSNPAPSVGSGFGLAEIRDIVCQVLTESQDRPTPENIAKDVIRDEIRSKICEEVTEEIRNELKMK